MNQILEESKFTEVKAKGITVINEPRTEFRGNCIVPASERTSTHSRVPSTSATRRRMRG